MLIFARKSMNVIANLLVSKAHVRVFSLSSLNVSANFPVFLEVFINFLVLFFVWFYTPVSE